MLILAAGICDSNAQESEYKKNSIYTTLGSIFWSSNVSLSYERMFLQNDKRMRTSAKIGYGHTLYDGFDYDENAKKVNNYVSLSAVQMFHLLEVSLGGAYTWYNLTQGVAADPDPDVDYDEIKSEIRPYVTLGFRYAKNNFLFRAGFSNMEFLYLGLGVNF